MSFGRRLWRTTGTRPQGRRNGKGEEQEEPRGSLHGAMGPLTDSGTADPGYCWSRRSLEAGGRR